MAPCRRASSVRSMGQATLRSSSRSEGCAVGAAVRWAVASGIFGGSQKPRSPLFEAGAGPRCVLHSIEGWDLPIADAPGVGALRVRHDTRQQADLTFGWFVEDLRPVRRSVTHQRDAIPIRESALATTRLSASQLHPLSGPNSGRSTTNLLCRARAIGIEVFVKNIRSIPVVTVSAIALFGFRLDRGNLSFDSSQFSVAHVDMYRTSRDVGAGGQ